MKIETLDQLLDAVDATTEGDGWVGHCPAHADSHPSLHIAVGETGVIIIKCRAHCETDEVLSKLGLTYGDLRNMDTGSVPTSRRVPSSKGRPATEDIAALAAQLDRYAKALTPEAAQYAERRFGLDAAACRRLGLGYTDELDGVPRLVVPFRDRQDMTAGFQARALTPDARVRWLGPHNPPGAAWSPIAWVPSTSGWSEVIICEGPGDALTAAGAGYNAIAVRGASLATKPDVIQAIADMLNGDPAIIAGDGDDAGQQFTTNLATGLSKLNVQARVLDIPDGQDLTDLRAEHPDTFAKQLVTMVNSAHTLAVAASIDEQVAKRTSKEYPLTDVGQAKFLRDFIQASGSQVRYTAEDGFYLLDRGVWQRDTLNRVRTYAQEAALRTSDWLLNHLPEKAPSMTKAEIDKLSDEEQQRRATNDSKRQRWVAFAERVQHTERINAAITELKALEGVATPISAFDQHPDLLAALNGVIDLRTGELLDHDPALLLTKRLDVDYNPNAEAPRWRQFLDEVLPQEGMSGFVQRLVGYGCSGHVEEQCFVILHGHGSNGKSVFTATLSRVFGSIATTTPFTTFEAKASGGVPNDLAALRGARLVFASEGEAGKPMAESLIKRVTGQDRIAARHLYKEWQEFEPTFLLILATNDKPNFRGVDEGLWRRVKLVPWTRYFAPDERDHYLGQKLLAEREGIVAWAVEGARQWYAGGLQEPLTVIEATKEYRATSDALAGFLPGVYVIDKTAMEFVPRSMVWADYVEWADQERLSPREVWQRRTFFRGLEDRGAVPVKSNGDRGFRGIRKATADEID